MPSPQNGILDNFNRADSTTTIGASWSNLFGTGTLDGIISNTVYNPTTAFVQYIGVYWNAQTFGSDSESFYTISTIPSNDSDNTALILRASNPGASWNGYGFGPSDSSKTQMQIFKSVGGAITLLGTPQSQATVSGDKLWFTAVGSTLTGYINHSGTWTQVCQVSDSTFSGAGYIGFYIPGNVVDGRFDDFGGGAVTSASSSSGMFFLF